MKAMEGIKTLSDKETLGTETIGDVIMQTLDELSLDNDGACLESIIEKVFTPEDLCKEPYTLYLNNQIVELEQQVHGLEAFNQVMKEKNWQNQGEVELLVEVKKQKQQVNVWKYQASKCYKFLKKVTKHLNEARGKNPKVVKA